uniref:Uncharacterized protein n=1 Tax=Octopus bimaculoides TaxID=37653 RepID=A0A0L8GVC8_OCTBM
MVHCSSVYHHFVQYPSEQDLNPAQNSLQASHFLMVTLELLNSVLLSNELLISKIVQLQLKVVDYIALQIN